MIGNFTGSADSLLQNETVTKGLGGHEGGLVADEQAMVLVNLLSRIILAAYSSMLFFAGITCNSLVMRVLLKRAGRRTHLWTYLVSLALSNICLLGAETSRYAIKGMVEVNYTIYSIGFCLVHRWMVMTSVITSNWLMVFITFGRWYILRHPTSSLSKNANLGLSVGLLVAFNGGLVVFVLLRLLVLHDTRMDGENVSACSLFREKSPEYVMVPLIIFTPMLMVVALNFMLYRQAKVQVKDIMIPTTNTQLSKIFYYRRLALLSVVANVHLLVTAIPVAIVSLGWSALFDSRFPLNAAIGQLVLQSCRLLWYGSYATNCLILCLQGAHFRNQMHKHVFGRFRDKGKTQERDGSHTSQSQEPTEKASLCGGHLGSGRSYRIHEMYTCKMVRDLTWRQTDPEFDIVVTNRSRI